MPTVKVVAAQSPLAVAMRDGNRFWVRGPAGDEPIPWDGDDPAMMVAALVSKWGFLPVVGKDGRPEPEIDEGQAALVRKVTLPDGGEAWRVEDTIPFER